MRRRAYTALSTRIPAQFCCRLSLPVAFLSLSTMSRPAMTSDSTAATAPTASPASARRRVRKRHRSLSSTPAVSPLTSTPPSLPFAAPETLVHTQSTTSGRIITRRGHGSHTAAGTINTSSTASLSSDASTAPPAHATAVGDAPQLMIESPPPVTIALPAPLPAVDEVPVTSSHLATLLRALFKSAHTSISLLPFYTKASNQKLVLHSVLVSSPSKSLLITFSSLPPTSLLPKPLVDLLKAAPVLLLLPTASSKRQLKSALVAWQRPAHFSLSSTVDYLTPVLTDLLSLSHTTSTFSDLSLASLAWTDEWTLSPPSGDDANAKQQLQRVSEYAMMLLQLYQRAHAISTEFTTFTRQQLQQLHAFNLHFLPPLPLSPHRFNLNPAVEAAFPHMQVPQQHRVHITQNHTDADRAISQLLTTLPAHQPMVGFDTESRPMFVPGQPNRPISLVQLSSLSMSVLCRVRVESGLPPALVRLLVDPKVRKVGQGIGGDVKQLHAQYGSGSSKASKAGGAGAMPETLLTSPSSHSLLDLESLSSCYSIHRIGLASLTAAFLSLRLSKAAQLSNWERHTLTPEQVSYAALDALVSLKLAQRLQQLKDDMAGIVRAWVSRGGRGGAGAGADGQAGGVDEERVWRWLTGKGMAALMVAREEEGEDGWSNRKRARQQQKKEKEMAHQLNPQQPQQQPSHPQKSSQQSQEQPQLQQQQHDKRRKAPPTGSQSARSSPSPAGVPHPRKQRHRSVAWRPVGGSVDQSVAVAVIKM